MNISIHKFGGASVKNADAVKNIAEILKSFPSDMSSIIVVSAMGKTTNKLENVASELNEDKAKLEIDKIAASHVEIANSLELSGEFMDKIWSLFSLQHHITDIDERYDATVSLGELASTRIISEYLKTQGYEASWWDVRNTITTDSRHRGARVDEEQMRDYGTAMMQQLNNSKFLVTQGFIGKCPSGATTTLGREGSDYSAALLACAADAKEVVIWKDVQGMHNADPRIFKETVTIDKLDYHEALELSYYGASVIHPRTVKPLQNRNIPLYLKSFLHPSGPNTCIGDFPNLEVTTPMYISRPNITCLSLGPTDHSFVGEDHLETVFRALSRAGIHVRMMQNSAVEFDLVFDTDQAKQDRFIHDLGSGFHTKSNDNLELITVRHGNADLLESLTNDKNVIMEQINLPTVRRLVKANS